MYKRIAFFISGLFLAYNIIGQTSDYYSPLTLRYSNLVYSPTIATVQLYPRGAPLLDPVIRFHSAELIDCSFDDLNGGLKSYRYTLTHCDAGWNPSDLSKNEYLEGYEDDEIRDYSFSFNTLQEYTHYYFSFPNEYISPTLSGNYVLIVYEDTPDKPIFTRRFMIYENIFTIDGLNAQRARLPQEMEQSQEVNFSLYFGQFHLTDQRQVKVNIMQNGRWDNMHMNVEPRSVGADKWDFELMPGNYFPACNEYRNLNLKSFRYNADRIGKITNDADGYQVWIQPDPARVFRPHVSETTLRGSMLIKTEDGRDDNLEGEYADVHFTIPFEYPLVGGNLFIIGKLSGNDLQPSAKMNFDYAAQEYEATLRLKQGFYNYLYVFQPDGSAAGECFRIEGNHYETLNDYYVMVYYRPIGARYDRLAGWSAFSM